MIPPPCHAFANSLPSLVRSTVTPIPIPTPSSLLHHDIVQISIGSYNPFESLLISSLRMSPSSQLDAGSEVFDKVSSSSWLNRSGLGKFASSLAASSREVMTTKTTGGGDGGERSTGRGRGRDREGGGEGGALAMEGRDREGGVRGEIEREGERERRRRWRGGIEWKGEREGHR